METIRIRLKNPPKPTRFKYLARPTATMNKVCNFLEKILEKEMKKPNPDKKLMEKLIYLQGDCTLMALQQQHDAKLLKELGIKTAVKDKPTKKQT